MGRKPKAPAAPPSLTLHHFFQRSEAASAPTAKKGDEGKVAASAPLDNKENEGYIPAASAPMRKKDEQNQAASAPVREKDDEDRVAASAPFQLSNDKRNVQAASAPLKKRPDSFRVAASAPLRVKTNEQKSRQLFPKSSHPTGKENQISTSKAKRPATSQPTIFKKDAKKTKVEDNQRILSQLVARDTLTIDLTAEDIPEKAIDHEGVEQVIDDDECDDDNETGEGVHEDDQKQVEIEEHPKTKQDQEDDIFGTDLLSDEDRYKEAGIKPHLATEHRRLFDARMKMVIEFIFGKAESVRYEELATNKSWVGRSFYHYMKNARSDAVFQKFQEIIPESTRTILGSMQLTEKQLSALPKVSPTCDNGGVYLCYVSEHIGKATGLYVGSTTKALMERLSAHRRNINHAKAGTKEVKGTFYSYFDQSPARRASFRQVAVFSNNGEVPTDQTWLIRLLETAIMLIADCFQAGRASPTYTVSQGELREFRNQLKSRENDFERLNVALPTKQRIQSSGIIGRRCCSNCSITKEDSDRKIKWFFDGRNPLATSFVCENCWRYKKRTNKDRPEHLWTEPRKARPKSGPCSNPNCQSETSKSHWQWHPDRTVERVLCSSCYTWSLNHNGEYRPLDIVNKTRKMSVCVICKVRKTDKWHSTEKGLVCNKCKDEIDNPQEVIAEVEPLNKCSLCGTEDSDAWTKTNEVILCRPCHQKSEILKKKRERTDCYNCGNEFINKAKQRRESSTSSIKLQQRRWSSMLSEWLCDTCFRTWTRQLFLRICTRDLRGLDIRCGLCRTLYSPQWYFNTHAGEEHLMCNRCKSSISQNPGRAEFKDHHDEARKEGYITYLEGHEKSEKSISKQSFFAWLKRIHGIDRSRKFVEAAKKAKDEEEEKGRL